MREKDTDPSSRDVPHCPLSERCVYFMNELAWQEENESDQPVLPMMRERGFDRGVIEQLREHARNCAVCTSALEEAWRARSVQRNELRELLKDEEQQVPSASEQIIHMLDNEESWRNRAIQKTPSEVGTFPLTYPLSGRRGGAERRTLLQSISSLVVVGIFILASSGLFGYLASLHATFVSKAGVAVEPASGWTSAVLTITQIGN